MLIANFIMQALIHFASVFSKIQIEMCKRQSFIDYLEQWLHTTANKMILAKSNRIVFHD
jgi:hypothetical protein